MRAEQQPFHCAASSLAFRTRELDTRDDLAGRDQVSPYSL